MSTNQIKNALIEKLKSKEAVVAIIGLGYVGLPLLLRFASMGYRALGFDIESKRVDLLNEGKSYISHISSEKISKVKNYFEATTDVSRIQEADGIIICVPTPLNKYREPDLSYVVETTESFLPYLRPGQVISLESTSYPGTTEEELQTRIESKGFKVGEDIFLVYSPEREDPGNPDYVTETIPKVCGGITENCLQVGVHLYEQVIVSVVPVSSTRAAEMTKLLENIHRSVNIGLMNEMKIVADKMGIDIFEVIRAAATKPFGFVPYYPGPGIGGHCIPIDPFYLTWKAREYGLHTRFIELAGEINSHMPKWVVEKTAHALNERKKALNGSRILVLGLSYKKNVADIREAPSLVILDMLKEKGAEIAYSDPHVPFFNPTRDHNFSLKSVTLTSENLAGFDCVLISTDHSLFDFQFIRQHAQLIIDTRGIYHALHAENIISA